MNGRIERTDGRLDLWSEPNYHAFEFFLRDQKRIKREKLAKDALRLVMFYGALWVIIWGVARGL